MALSCLNSLFVGLDSLKMSTRTLKCSFWMSGRKFEIFESPNMKICPSNTASKCIVSTFLGTIFLNFHQNISKRRHRNRFWCFTPETPHSNLLGPKLCNWALPRRFENQKYLEIGRSKGQKRSHGHPCLMYSIDTMQTWYFQGLLYSISHK